MNLLFQKFVLARISDPSAPVKELLYQLIKQDKRTRHSAYYMATHGYEQFILIASSKYLLQAEQHADGKIIIILNHQEKGYFDLDSQPDKFFHYLKLF